MLKIMHLIAPRTGPNNEGPNECLKCGATIFKDDDGFEDGLGGSTHVVYDPATAEHTTDEPTWLVCGTDMMPDFNRCA